jgi:hypothetical protein
MRIEIRTVTVFILLLQEVLDMTLRAVMLMLLRGHTMAIILVESGNHRVTTNTPHKIMTVVVGQHRALTIGRGVGKTALTGGSQNDFAF